MTQSEPTEPRTTPEHAFFHLVESFALGIRRLQSARIVSLSAQLAVLQYRTSPAEDLSGHRYEDVLRQIHNIARDELDGYTYLTNVSHLTYATTLLDTFLSDCTRFLLLLHPGAVGKNQSVTLQDVLGAKSRADVVNQAVEKRVRELGHAPFVGRLEFLEKSFGLSLDLPPETVAALEHHSSVRNVAIHDQGVFEVYLDDTNTLEIRKKTCPLHPTPVKNAGLKAALAAYRTIVSRITGAVVTQILKVPDSEYGRDLRAIATSLGERDDTTEAGEG